MAVAWVQPLGLARAAGAATPGRGACLRLSTTAASHTPLPGNSQSCSALTEQRGTWVMQCCSCSCGSWSGACCTQWGWLRAGSDSIHVCTRRHPLAMHSAVPPSTSGWPALNPKEKKSSRERAVSRACSPMHCSSPSLPGVYGLRSFQKQPSSWLAVQRST